MQVSKLARKITIFLTSIIMVMMLGFSATFAWIASSQNTISVKIAGRIVQEYFHSGTGDEDDPFVITRPIHYYHLVEFFQRETELDISGDEQEAIERLFGVEYLYFQLGSKDLDKDGVDELDTPQVFAYDNSGDMILDGNGNPTYTNTLNMAYYSGGNSLMPIGSSEVPFYGGFYGNNLIVDNLSIIASETVVITRKDDNGHLTYTEKDRSTSDIGIFGYVKNGSGAANIYFDNVTINLVGTSAAANGNDHEAHDKVYVGYLAGHVGSGTVFIDTYINNCKILGGNAATSNFGYFGRVDNAEGQEVPSLKDTIQEFATEGDDAGWGGSVDMYNMFKRAYTGYTKATRAAYPTEEIRILDENGHIISQYVTETAQTANNTFRWYSSTDGGSFYYKQNSNTTSWTSAGQSYIYLSGNSAVYTKTVKTYQYNGEYVDAFAIHSDDNYLSISSSSGTFSVENSSYLNSAKWVHEANTNYLYTMVPNPADETTSKHYLNRNGDSLTLGNTGTTAWIFEEVNGQKQIYTLSSGSKYYLLYNAGWIITNTDIPYVIGDGSSNYLAADLNGVNNSRNISNATKWTISSETGNTSFMTTVEGEHYYLGVDENGLGLKETSSTWTKDGDSFYLDYGGFRHYLAYDNGWKIKVISGYNIYYDNNYLAINNTYANILIGSENDILSLWQIEENNGNYSIYHINNMKKYYLSDAGNGIDISISETEKTWLKDSNGYYIQNGIHKLYLTYDNGWRLRGYYEFSFNGNYLGHNQSNIIFSTTTKDEKISWIMENPLGFGHIYYVDGANKYYLSAKRGADNSLTGELEIITNESQATLWSLDSNNRIYLSDNNANYYIGFNQGNWQLAISWYAIHDDNGHYLSLNATNDGVTSASDATSVKAQWYMNIGGETTYIYSKVNGTTYYLSFENNTLGLSSTPFTWNLNDQGFYVLFNEVKYFLLYDNGWSVEDLQFYGVTDGKGNFIAINDEKNGIVNSTDNSIHSGRLHISNPEGETSIYYDEYGTHYYLDYDSQTNDLIISATDSKWLKDEIGYYKLINDVKMYIIYNGSDWKVGHWYAITDNNGHFLSLNANKNGITSVSDVTSYSARWQIETTNSGKAIYCEIDGQKYYLGLNNTSDYVGVLNISNSAYNWNVTISDNAISAIYAGNANGGSYLAYKGGWRTIKLDANSIKGADGHYFSANANYNGVTDTDFASSTKWYIEAPTGSGRIFTLNENTGELQYLVGNANGTYSFTTNAANASTFEYVSYPGTYRVLISGEYYYLTYASETWIDGSVGWKLVRLQYLISCTYTRNWTTVTGYLQYSGTTISMNNTKNNSTSKWTFSTIGASPSGTIKNDDNRYLATSGNNLSITTNSQTWTNTNNRLLNTTRNRYLSTQTTGGFFGFGSTTSWTLDNTGTNITFTPTVTSVTLEENDYTSDLTSNDILSTSSFEGEATPNISFSLNDVNNGTANYNDHGNILNITSSLNSLAKSAILLSKSFETIYDADQLKLWDYISSETKNSGRPSYIPLKAQLTDPEDKASFYDDLRVDETNTGYIVSSGYSGDGTTESSSADIRISKYRMNNLSASTNITDNIAYSDTHDANLQVLTRTISSNGYVRILDSYNQNTTNISSALSGYSQMGIDQLGLIKYEQQDTSGNQISLARAGLSTMLKDSGSFVYGLHFMDALISQNHLITADKAVVNGQTYYNYELPEASIDFTLPQRGIINFFAGSYYITTINGQNVTNDTFFSLHEIFRNADGHITSIKELSKIYASNENPEYIYEYATSSGGGYSGGHTSLPSGYSLIFDLSWITNPGNDMIDNAVYYFEIPVNAGEFALGSVSGKNGAYLMYLDIAANGGEMSPENVSSVANDVATLFKVEYRNSPDTVDHSIIQFALDIPENSENKFDVSVKFDKTQVVEGVYDSGLYIITINNTTTSPIELTVFLLDDDNDPATDFTYAYQIVYNGEIYKNGIYNYWKSYETHTLGG